MIRTVELRFPSVGDAELEVLYLGKFPNNKVSEVTEAQARYWENETGNKWPASGKLVLPQGEQVESSQQADDSDDDQDEGD